jgi:tyrosine-specific transport protein
MPKDSNLITMAGRLLGNKGKVICWLVYLFLFEMIMIAHIVGGGSILNEIFPGQLLPWQSTLIYVLLFSPIVYLGTHTVDRINILMFSGVLLSYFSFIFISYNHVNLKFLTFHNWGKAYLALPVLLTAFTYQVIIPTLMTYMNRDVIKVRKAIIFGTSIPLIVYLVWQVMILGIIPVDGSYGLSEAAKTGQNAVSPLKHFVQSSTVNNIARAFAFFTMTTSYIALSLAFLDFLADGLKVKKKGIRKIILCLAIFVPPLIVSLINPNIFLIALGYAGGISCAILFGLYPPLMAWIGRYQRGYKTEKQLFGGKAFLAFLILFILGELSIELMSLFTS